MDELNEVNINAAAGKYKTNKESLSSTLPQWDFYGPCLFNSMHYCLKTCNIFRNNAKLNKESNDQQIKHLFEYFIFRCSILFWLLYLFSPLFFPIFFIFLFLGSMLPQFMAFCVSFCVRVSKKNLGHF